MPDRRTYLDLPFDAFLRAYALMEGVLHQRHIGDGIGHIDDRRRRAAMPKPELDLPLPLSVATTITPASRCAARMLASITAFLRCMRALWRWLRPSGSIVLMFGSIVSRLH